MKPSAAPASYLDDGHTLRSWLFTTDHKRIALLYLGTITFFFFIGGFAAALIRYNLISPKGLLGSAETYNKLFSMHGMVMVWFFLVPAVPVTLGNFLVPLMLGARDLAFPRLNLLSWYLFCSRARRALCARRRRRRHRLDILYAADVVLLQRACRGDGRRHVHLGFFVDRDRPQFHRHHPQAPRAGHDLVTACRVPLVALRDERHSGSCDPGIGDDAPFAGLRAFFRIGVFDPAIGGDPLLFQHLFWFYSHPAVYVMILPGFGVVSEIIPTFASRTIRLQIRRLGEHRDRRPISFLVWGHHMFVAGTSLYSALVFSILSYMVAVPSAIKVFNWIGTMHKGWIRFDAPDALRDRVHRPVYDRRTDRSFPRGAGRRRASHANILCRRAFPLCDGRRHGVGLFCGLHFWWPKMTGRLYPEMWGRAAAIVIYVGFNLTFLPQFLLGYLGMPRRSFTIAAICGAQCAVVRRC